LNNTAKDKGGAIYLENIEGIIAHSLFVGNRAKRGAVLYAHTST